MLIAETIAKTRRAHFVQKKPIRVICRELHMSRKLVRRVNRSAATEFRYEQAAQPLPKLGPGSLRWMSCSRATRASLRTSG